MKGLKLLWVGLTMMIALGLVLSIFGINASNLVSKLGAIIMVIGAVLYCLDK